MTIYVNQEQWNRIKEADERELTPAELEYIKHYKFKLITEVVELNPSFSLKHNLMMYNVEQYIQEIKERYYYVMHSDVESRFFYRLVNILK